ncbi:hypothetical protein KEX41_29690 (plasmid) [Burkholderia thailandensis]|uniref:hypothetical protein n=1 Tax=Burkholderia thailandensis TaxID=57975 RepID=UPI00192D5EB4|nr:hypothetical protein [Burkholderia thailandensis]MBS2132357.1 hypothetical protein [Burkholderia thailandensis]QRA15162.1 hypothetical protein JMY07_30115 [Burkholderia thailandensis]
MAIRKRDVVIHYDEDKEEIVFYTTDLSRTESIRAAEFDGMRVETSFLRDKSPSDAEQALGRTVFALLERGASVKFGIRDYAAEAEEAQREHVQQLERDVLAGSAEACYHLGLHLHYSAMKHASKDNLERAETLIRDAAHAGYPQAEKILKQWPDLKDAALRTIERRRNSRE